MTIEVLEPTASNMYLGRALSLVNVHETEFDHRLRRAWAKFGTYHAELTNKLVPLNLRMKLFHSVVSPSVLYGCCSWVMTEARKTQLQSAQLKMARKIMGMRRAINGNGEVESWVEWLQRVTPKARDIMRKANIPNWSEEVRSRYVRWYHKVASMPADRWARKVLQWEPNGHRAQGRPVRRWSEQQC